MKKFLIGVGIFLVILSISALLAPAIYSVTDFKFERILSRCVMVQTIGVVIYFAARALKRDGAGKVFSTYGLNWQGRRSFNALTVGFVTSAGVLSALLAVEVFLGARFINVRFHMMSAVKLVEYLFAALLIGVIEEYFFRGIVFNKLRTFSLLTAFIVTNIFYSIVHFFRAHGTSVGETATVGDSVRVLVALIKPLAHPVDMVPGFVGLLLFGLVLSMAYYMTGSLFCSIGIHAGCVFVLKADGFFIGMDDAVPVWLYGDKNIYNGILGWGFIVLIGVLIYSTYLRKIEKA